jgi:hypothetical protein
MGRLGSAWLALTRRLRTPIGDGKQTDVQPTSESQPAETDATAASRAASSSPHSAQGILHAPGATAEPAAATLASYVALGAVAGAALLVSVAVGLAAPKASVAAIVGIGVSGLGAALAAASLARGYEQRRQLIADTRSEAIDQAAKVAAMTPNDPERPQGNRAMADAELTLWRLGAYDDVNVVHDARLFAAEPAFGLGGASGRSPPFSRAIKPALLDEQLARFQAERQELGSKDDRPRWRRRLAWIIAPPTIAVIGTLAACAGAAAAIASTVRESSKSKIEVKSVEAKSVEVKKFSPVINEPPEPAPIVKYRPVINVSPSIAGGGCVVYFAALDELVDDEPAIARHLPGGKLPLDATAKACGLRNQRELNALATVLARR